MTKIIETEDFLRLSLISYQDNSTHNTVPKLNITSHTCTLIRDLRDQFLRFETEQVQSQQARPRLKRYSLNKRDQDSCSRIFETETETKTKTRKMCIFETETETRKMVETESLTDLCFSSSHAWLLMVFDFILGLLSIQFFFRV